MYLGAPKGVFPIPGKPSENFLLTGYIGASKGAA